MSTGIGVVSGVRASQRERTHARPLAVAERWSSESPTPETAWIVRHGMRVLVKNGDPRALALLGATGGEHIRLRDLHLSPTTVRLGGALTLSVDVENTDRAGHTVVVDYVVHHVRSNGRTIPKVFKLASVALAPGERRALTKNHPIREVTTRTYYAGAHTVDVQVNGRVIATDRFELTT